ncbi:aspartic proteinase 36-like isoform X2 [Salvia splendens]|uniref:aspartic proteinase 36-like isoform X2 n=1 Tax=Salvia splendens TaxID=180675 RepID=UPI001C281204|nr:aspartic proteinase 36-like isoform X2 [Salvia splendens]
MTAALVAIAVAFAIAAATFLSTVRGGAGIEGVLTLHRAFPIDEEVELHVIKARDRARHARILQSFSGGIVDFQIDTGSDILWVACSSCTDCPQNSGLGIPLNFFDPGASSTVSSISCSDNICASIVQTAAAECFGESNQCGYSFQYADQSGTAGFYVSDILYFDSILTTSLVVNSSAPIVFGCSTSLFGDLAKSTKALDGIFGFGRQDISVISQLSSHKITPNVFSHCLKGDGNGGGIFALGEILDPRIVYTPLVPSQPHYNLYLQSISVNGELLPIDPTVFATSVNQGTIVDSGTTLVYLVEAAYEPFIAAIAAAVSTSASSIISNGNQCYLVSTSVAEIFPPVSFNFAGGASMYLKPIDYLVRSGFVDGASMWCVGFLKASNQGTTILGDLVLKDKIFVYDLAQQRLGWADYDCSLSVNVSLTPSKDEFMNAGQLSVSSSSFLSTSTAALYILVVILVNHFSSPFFYFT